MQTFGFWKGRVFLLARAAQLGRLEKAEVLRRVVDEPLEVVQDEKEERVRIQVDEAFLEVHPAASAWPRRLTDIYVLLLLAKDRRGGDRRFETQVRATRLRDVDVESVLTRQNDAIFEVLREAVKLALQGGEEKEDLLLMDVEFHAQVAAEWVEGLRVQLDSEDQELLRNLRTDWANEGKNRGEVGAEVPLDLASIYDAARLDSLACFEEQRWKGFAQQEIHGWAGLVSVVSGRPNVLYSISSWLTPHDLWSLSASCQELWRMCLYIVPGLTLGLYPHQIRSLDWMLKREAEPEASAKDAAACDQRLAEATLGDYGTATLLESRERFLATRERARRSETKKENVPFEQCHQSRSAGMAVLDDAGNFTMRSSYTAADLTGPSARSKIGEGVRGGLLCDEPGLGKTVSVIALMCKKAFVRSQSTRRSGKTAGEERLELAERGWKATEAWVRYDALVSIYKTLKTKHRKELSENQDLMHYFAAALKEVSRHDRSPVAQGRPAAAAELRGVKEYQDDLLQLVKPGSGDMQSTVRTCVEDLKESFANQADRAFKDRLMVDQELRDLVPTRATLIIVPDPLVDHWEEQLRIHVDWQHLLRCFQAEKAAARHGTGDADASGVANGPADGKDRTSARMEMPSGPLPDETVFRRFVYVGRGSLPQKLYSDDPDEHALITDQRLVVLLPRKKISQLFRALPDEAKVRTPHEGTRTRSRRLDRAEKRPSPGRVMAGQRREAENLQRVNWLRLIVDEGHGVAQQTVNYTKLLKTLYVERKWVMSGTPTRDSDGFRALNSLYALLVFLGEPCYGSQKKQRYWNAQVAENFKNGRPHASYSLRRILSRLMIRHVKSDVPEIPSPIESDTILRMSREEAFNYNARAAFTMANIVLTEKPHETSINRESLLHPGNHRDAMGNVDMLLLMCNGGGRQQPNLRDNNREDTRLLFGQPASDKAVQTRRTPLIQATEEQWKRVNDFMNRAVLGRTSRCCSCGIDLQLQLITPCAHTVCVECVTRDIPDVNIVRCLHPGCGHEFPFDDLQQVQPGFDLNWQEEMYEKSRDSSSREYRQRLERARRHNPAEGRMLPGRTGAQAGGAAALGEQSGDSERDRGVKVLAASSPVVSSRRLFVKAEQLREGKAQKDEDAEPAFAKFYDVAEVAAGGTKSKYLVAKLKALKATERQSTVSKRRSLPGMPSGQRRKSYDPNLSPGRKSSRSVLYKGNADATRAGQQSTVKAVVFSCYRRVLNLIGHDLISNFGQASVAEFWGSYRSSELQRFRTNEQRIWYCPACSQPNNLNDQSCIQRILGVHFDDAEGLEAVYEKDVDEYFMGRLYGYGERIAKDGRTGRILRFAKCTGRAHRSKVVTERCDCFVMLLGRDGSHGLDLSFVTHIFLMESIWNSSLERQVISRAHRMGTIHPVQVEQLVAGGTVDEVLHRLKTGELTVQKEVSKNYEGVQLGLAGRSTNSLVAPAEGSKMRFVLRSIRLMRGYGDNLALASPPSNDRQTLEDTKPLKPSASERRAGERDDAASAESRPVKRVRFNL